MINQMEEVPNYILMEADMKENLDSVKKREKDNSYGEMEPSTKANLRMDLCKEKESTTYQMDKLTKVSSERTKDMVEERISLLQGPTLAATKEIKSKDRVNLFGQMVKSSKVLSTMVNLMAKDLC